MILNNRTKKIFKVLCLVLFVAVLSGCTSNLNKEGQLIASRAINEATAWNWSAGWFDFLFVIPLAKGIIFATKYLGNVAFGVVAITILINIITLPIMIKSTVSSQKMQLLQPEIEKIQRKYKGRKDQASQMRMNNEIQALYKKNDVSMFGSLVTFLTLPIMFAMWQSVQRIEILYQTTFLGINLGSKPMDHIFNFEIVYIILIILVAGSQFFAMEITSIMAKRNPRYKVSKQAKSMRTMNNVMTVFIIYLAMTMPAAMSLYWITTNLINIIRTVYIQIHHIEKTKEEVHKTNTNYLNKK